MVSCRATHSSVGDGDGNGRRCLALADGGQGGGGNGGGDSANEERLSHSQLPLVTQCRQQLVSDFKTKFCKRNKKSHIDLKVFSSMKEILSIMVMNLNTTHPLLAVSIFIPTLVCAPRWVGSQPEGDIGCICCWWYWCQWHLLLRSVMTNRNVNGSPTLAVEIFSLPLEPSAITIVTLGASTTVWWTIGSSWEPPNRWSLLEFVMWWWW